MERHTQVQESGDEHIVLMEMMTMGLLIALKLRVCSVHEQHLQCRLGLNQHRGQITQW